MTNDPKKPATPSVTTQKNSNPDNDIDGLSSTLQGGPAPENWRRRFDDPAYDNAASNKGTGRGSK